MKKRFLFVMCSLLAVAHCFSQTVMQKKTVTKTPATVVSPVVHQDVSTRTPVATNTAQSNLNQNSNNKVDSASATLLDAYFSLSTGSTKNGDMHWSCAVFDQNNKQVASFQDESNSDVYAAGSQTPELKMKTDNATVFGNFSGGGRLQINITSNGNDAWEINSFNLTLDFLNPRFTERFTWKGINLTQDKKSINLSFGDQVNSTTGYDLKANKKM